MPSACELKQFNLKLFPFFPLVERVGERGGGAGEGSHLEPLLAPLQQCSCRKDMVKISMDGL